MVNSMKWQHCRGRGAGGAGSGEPPRSITHAESYDFCAFIVHHFGMKRNEGNAVHMFCIAAYLINRLFIHDHMTTMTL